MKKQTIEYYQNNANELLERYESADVENLHESLLKVFPIGSKLLEIGCGSGRDANFLLKNDYDVYGIDASDAMLKAAELAHPELKGRLTCVTLPNQIGFPNSSLDGVYAIATLMHLSKTEIRQVLFNIFEILKPEGKLLFSVSVCRSDTDENGFDAKGRFFNEIPPQGWMEMCRKVGFEILKTSLSEDGLSRKSIKWFNCLASKSSYDRMPEVLKSEIVNELKELGLSHKDVALRGELFEITAKNVGVLIDYKITEKKNAFSYSDYTKEQNGLMAKYDKLFRFMLNETKDIPKLKDELLKLLNEDFEEESILQRGINRSKEAIDPTCPEALFEQAFIETYGRESLACVSREYPVLDLNGETRWIDYFVKTSKGGIAIEKNGEVWHHPVIIGKTRYGSQLIKQNSIVAYGYKVFRWSLEGMKFKDSFSDEIKSYLGSKESFKLAQGITCNRNLAQYEVKELYDHQKEILAKIENDRSIYGKNSFLIVFPTGTGKTEVMIRDIEREAKKHEIFKALILVPQLSLKNQTIEKVSSAINFLTVGDDRNSQVFVQTYAWMCRYFQSFDADAFHYVVVDEAHHALAPSIRKAISQFAPQTLLGLTATDKRLDSQKLEDVFGTYETQFSLKEAIEKRILATIKAFRLKSNIDLSEVRYNGKDYVASDLEKTVVVESRNNLIVDLLEKYFVSSEPVRKSGIVFCVSVDHANRIAKIMQARGIKAKAISGRDGNSEKYIEEYQEGKIQFLCTCSLLNEGWDSPRTSVIVMARPTMSKVLYTQQIGRGTRKMEGKEALYVIDVVDNYSHANGFKNSPWSIHALLGIPNYLPWGNILNPKVEIDSGNKEEIILAGLYEEERALEVIDLFTFENQYPDHLSTEQMARELFVSTGTVSGWISKKKIEPSVSIPLGNRFIHYFAKDRIDEVRKTMGLKIHNEETQYEDFFEFLKEGDYVYSYKMIMLLSFLAIADKNGECNLDSLVRLYSVFYLTRLKLNLPVDRETCPYKSLEYLEDINSIKKSILQNPFEKYERKRFMYHCKDLNHVAFSPSLWSKINNNTDIPKIKELQFNDLIKYYENLGGIPNRSELEKMWKIS